MPLSDKGCKKRRTTAHFICTLPGPWIPRAGCKAQPWKLWAALSPPRPVRCVPTPVGSTVPSPA